MTAPKGIETKGRRLLKRWLAADPSRNATKLAKLLGITQPAVSGWLRGITRPEQAHRDMLFELCGIPQAAWELPEERARRERAMANIAALDPTGTDGGR